MNRRVVDFDPRPPMVTSGSRIGTPALATRGFAEVADIIALALQPEPDIDRLRARVAGLAARHPLYSSLTSATAIADEAKGG